MTREQIDAIFIRGFDILFSILGLIVVLPIMAIVAFLIWLEDHGPFLFVQQRVGKDLVPFNIFKFRTMAVDEKRHSGQIDQASDSGIVEQRQSFQTAKKNDPRITKMGKIIRPLNLDELPQLINVLIGDMSLVGVRPDVAVQEADYDPKDWRERHRFRPGVTGLAHVESQIGGMAKRTEKDLEWIRSRSVVLYFRILVATLYKVLRRDSV